MKLFLTSSMGASIKENGIRIPCAMDNSNHFVDILRDILPDNSHCIIISSNPEDYETSEIYKKIYKDAFCLSKLPVTKVDTCDSRNDDNIAETINNYNIVILSGGHVPTENAYFKKLNLKKILSNYNGIIIGISAGTMNCAEVVYSDPELDGEAIDPDYKRYIDGLGLTKINIVPHFQDIGESMIDGLRVHEDIHIPDSYVRPFYALVDGSFVLVENGVSTLYGEGYYFENGSYKKICDIDKTIILN